jgi:F-type H+-transporting ATPase subunit epsilon
VLKVDIVTPSGNVLEAGNADSLRLPTLDGEITVLPGHVSLVSVLGKGVIIFNVMSSVASQTKYVVYKGFVEIPDGEKVIITAEKIVKADALNKVELETQKKDLELKLTNKDLPDSDRKKYQDQLEDAVIGLSAI